MLIRCLCLAAMACLSATAQAFPSVSHMEDTQPPVFVVEEDPATVAARGLVRVAETLPDDVATRAMEALMCAQDSGMTVDTVIVVDMGQPATAQRLWAFDMRPSTPRLLLNDLVAHGAGSDRDADGIPERFSDTVDSHMTSLGLYRVAERYRGKNGWSRRLDGLFAKFNGRARDRAVVMHPSSYVTKTTAGRSQGCPAVSQETMDALEQAGLANAVLWIDGPDQQVHQEVAHCAQARKVAQMAQMVRARRQDAAQALVTRLNEASWALTIVGTPFNATPRSMPLIAARPSEPAPGDPEAVCMPALMRPKLIRLCTAPLGGLSLGFAVYA